MADDRKRRVTAADVAAAAGVSRSAVSRAFTEGAYLDKAKRTLILQTAEALGYRPNALAAGLQGGQSNLVAIFVGEMSNQYDKEVTASMVMGLNAAGKWPIVIGGSGQTAHDAISNVLRYPLDALIMRSGSIDFDVSAACAKLNIPVISSGRLMPEAQVDTICVRNEDGMAAGTHLLIERGRRKFAFVSGPERFWSSGERRKGFRRALDAHGLTPVFETFCDFSVQGGFDVGPQISALPAVDAVVCANDAIAIGLIGYMAKHNVKVPDDVAVIGFDDIAMSGWPSVNLTTVRNPVAPLVSGIIDLLDRRTANPQLPPQMIWVETELVLRGTH